MATTGTVRSDVNIQDLLEAGLHFGHQTKRWNPKMKRYIFAQRNGIYIIDLAKSLASLTEARQFIYDIVARGRKVLLVGTKKQAQGPIREAAEKLKMPYIVNRWLGGTLTNNQTIRKSVTRMRELEKLEEDGTINDLPKKEIAKIRRELAKMQYNLSGIADMDNLPGAMFVVDIVREAIAVAEANRLKIPVIAIVDTNCDPDPIDYTIPGNDDAIRSIRLIVESISSTIQQAENEYAKVAAEEARRKAAEEAEAAAKAKAAEEERKKRQAEEQKAREEATAKAKVEAAAAAEVKKAEAAKAAAEAAKAEKAAQAAKPAEAAKEATKAEEPAPADKPAEKEPEAKAEVKADKPAEEKAAKPAPADKPVAEAKVEEKKPEPAKAETKAEKPAPAAKPAEKKPEAKAETKADKPAAEAKVEEKKAEAPKADEPAEEKAAKPKAEAKPAEEKAAKPVAEPKVEEKTAAAPKADKPAEK